MEKKRYKLIAIGGGPAGIAVAIECISLGMDPSEVLILEKGDAPIAAIRQFYPEKKMTLPNYKGLPTETFGHLQAFPDLTKAETLVYFDELIEKYSLNLVLNKEVSKVIPHKNFFEIQCGEDIFESEFVVVAIGILGRPNKPGYRLPIKLRNHLLFDMTSQEIKQAKVLVVGGGDTASEYCQYLQGMNNTVTLAYRQSTFYRMMSTNHEAVVKLHREGKVDIRYSCDIEKIEEQEEKPLVCFKDGVQERFDKVLFALGGTTPVNFLKTIGVEFEGDWPKLGEDGSTNIPNLFLLGDLHTGKKGGSIILCYKSAYFAAKTMMEK